MWFRQPKMSIIPYISAPKKFTVSIKEKCEADFAYSSEGCGKTRTEINAPMPHTRYICETSGRTERPFTIEYTKNECYPSILLF